jgi:hypothetical protein
MTDWPTAAGAELRGIGDPASRCAHRSEPRSGPRGGDRWEWTDRHERNGHRRLRLRDQAVSCLGQRRDRRPPQRKPSLARDGGKTARLSPRRVRSCQPRARRRSPLSACPGLAAIVALHRRSVDRDRLTWSISSRLTVFGNLHFPSKRTDPANVAPGGSGGSRPSSVQRAASSQACSRSRSRP